MTAQAQPRLTALPAADGLLPVSIGSVHLSEAAFCPITSVAPFKGQEGAVAGRLGAWPAPNRAEGPVLWAGLNLAFVLGECPDLGDLAATTDQTDAWAHLVLAGAGVDDVLARLCPLDLAQMAPGHTARSLLGHMNALYWRRAPEAMEVFVFRSMTTTAVHEITRAMGGVAARG